MTLHPAGRNRRIKVLLAANLGLLCLIAALGFTSFREAENRFASLRHQNIRILQILAQANEAFQQLRLARTLYLTGGVAERQRLRREEASWQKIIETTEAQLSAMLVDSANREVARSWGALNAQLKEDRQSFYQLVDNGEEGAAKASTSATLARSQEMANKLWLSLHDHQIEDAQKKERGFRQTMGFREIVFFGLIGLCLLTSLLGYRLRGEKAENL